MRVLVVLLFSLFLFAQSKYCKDENIRSTLIYIDLSSTNNKEFSKKLIKGLKNSFLPHERVKIFFVNPSSSEVEEIFNACVPKLSKEEIKKIKEKGGLYLFGGNPIEQANEDLMLFYARLKSIFDEAKKRYIESEEKPLIEIFYNEEDKFANPLNRIIIYSDMVQNSEEIPIESIINKKKINLKDYQVNYNYSNIYVLLNKKALKGSEFKKLKDFWNCYYESNNGYIKNFNTTLNIPKFNGLNVKKYEGSMKYSDGSEFKVKLLLSYDNKGNINNGWFIINEIDSVPVSGKVYIKGNKISKAKLKAIPLCKNHYIIRGEKINLAFKHSVGKGEMVVDNTKTIIKTPKGNIIENPKVKLVLKESE